MPVKVQIAIQGGGAKLPLLLAAMHALHESPDIKVTRIAATSAGAIAACLFASGADPKEIRRRLAEKRAEFASAFRLPKSKLEMAYGGLKLIRGKSLWREAPIINALDQLMDSKEYVELEHFRKTPDEAKDPKNKKRDIDVILVSTDLRYGRVHRHKSSEHIVQSVLHSCGLPYLFRVHTPSAATLLADGGLCENLPIEVLKADEAKYGPVLAISFAKSAFKHPTNIFEFSMALADVAISHSVERSKLFLEKSSVLEFETHLGLTDFDLALSTEGPLGGLSPNVYDTAKDKSSTFFATFLDRQERDQWLPDDPWATKDANAIRIMNQAYKVADLLIKPVDYSHISFEVIANSLIPKNAPGKGALDHRILTTSFTTREPVIGRLAGTITSAGVDSDYLGLTKWRFEQNHTVIREQEDTIAVPVRVPVSPGGLMDNHREFAIYLKMPLPPSPENPYTFVFEDSGMDLLKNLREKGRDDLGQGLVGSVGQIDLVLHIPKAFGPVALKARDDSTVIGNPMSKEALARYSAHRPPGFETLGWTGKNLSGEVRFVCDVISPGLAK